MQAGWRESYTTYAAGASTDRNAAFSPQKITAQVIDFLQPSEDSSVSHSLASMSDSDREIACALIDEWPDTSIEPTRGLTFYRSGFGRCHCRLADQELLDYGDPKSVGPAFTVKVPADLVDLALSRHRRLLERERLWRRIFVDRLDRAAQTDELKTVLSTVDDAVRHVEAVYFFFDDRLCSVMERSTTLIDRNDKPGILGELKRHPYESWNDGDKSLISILYALYLSGRSTRFEEFNGRTLTARGVIALFDRLEKSYQNRALNFRLSARSDPWIAARSLGKLYRSSAERRALPYRKIYAPTFLKTEHMIDQLDGDCSFAVPPLFIDRFRALPCSRKNAAVLNARDVFTALARDAISATCESENTYARDRWDIHDLIENLVASAVFSVDADYGMSSGLRRVAPLINSYGDEHIELIMKLKPKDFFCCVIGTDAMADSFVGDLIRDVFRPVQARMQYNRWHFIAGNHDNRTIPANRHYFYPPLLPDIADWSDLKHSGHTRARVRYAIRAPGPDIMQSPLVLGGFEYRALYDVRTVRCAGRPFTEQDMLQVRQHNIWMGHVWSEIISSVRQGAGLDGDEFIISGFENGQGRTLPGVHYGKSVGSACR